MSKYVEKIRSSQDFFWQILTLNQVFPVSIVKHLTLSFPTYKKAKGPAMIKIHILFSISSTNIWINTRKEAIGFYNIHTKTRRKPCLLFTCYSAGLKQFILQQNCLTESYEKLKLSFGKVQGIMFYKFLAINDFFTMKS